MRTALSRIAFSLLVALAFGLAPVQPAFAKSAGHGVKLWRHAGPVGRYGFAGFDARRLHHRPRFARANIAIVIGATGGTAARAEETLCLPGRYCVARLGFGPAAPKIITLNRTGRAIRCLDHRCAPIE